MWFAYIIWTASFRRRAHERCRVGTLASLRELSASGERYPHKCGSEYKESYMYVYIDRYINKDRV